MNAEQLTKIQHFVPEFLLDNFSGDDGHLIKYVCKYKTYSKKTPAQICYKYYLYETRMNETNNDDENFISANYLEKQFRDKETDYSQIIRKIVNCYQINTSIQSYIDKEKEVLASFTSNLLLRNPVIMDRAGLNGVLKGLWLPKKTILLMEYKKKLGYKNIESYATDRKKMMWLDHYDSKSAQSILCKDILSDMSISIYISSGKHFITSNFPILFKVNEALKLMFVAIPLSPTHLLVYLPKEDTYDLSTKIYYADDRLVESANKLMLRATAEPIEYLCAKERKDIEDILDIVGEKNDQT